MATEMKMENNCLFSMTHDPDCSYLYPCERILTVRLYLFLVLQSLVYVNLSKSMLPKGAHLSPDRPRRGGHLSFAGAKVQQFLNLAKHEPLFFIRERIFLHHTYYIYYAREGFHLLEDTFFTK